MSEGCPLARTHKRRASNCLVTSPGRGLPPRNGSGVCLGQQGCCGSLGLLVASGRKVP